MGRNSAKLGGATKAASVRGGATTADMGAWASDNVKRGSASVATRPGRTGERAAETGGRVAVEEVERRAPRPFRTYQGVRFARSQIYLIFNVSAIQKLTILSV